MIKMHAWSRRAGDTFCKSLKHELSRQQIILTSYNFNSTAALQAAVHEERILPAQKEQRYLVEITATTPGKPFCVF